MGEDRRHGAAEKCEMRNGKNSKGPLLRGDVGVENEDRRSRRTGPVDKLCVYEIEKEATRKGESVRMSLHRPHVM